MRGRRKQNIQIYVYIYILFSNILGAFHLHQNSDKSHFCLSLT